MPSTEKILRTRELPSLAAPVDPARFVEATGERVALLGHEEGPFECWFWPIKILSDLRFGLRRAGVPFELPEREVTVLPGELFYVWKGNGVQLRVEVFACRERSGLALGFALDSEEPLELEVSFRCDLRPMWPAGFGGQLGRVDKVTKAFALSEELGRYGVLVGALDGRVEFDAVEHGLPTGKVHVYVPLEAGGSSTVLGIAAAEVQPGPLSEGLRAGKGSLGYARAERAVDAARELWFRLVSDFSEEREAVRVFWRDHQERTLSIETPEPDFDRAFLWSQIAIERAWVRVEGLGRGVVGGLGASGSSDRPGKGWFFDGEALSACRGMTLSGDVQGARDVLRFVASHQRADGKLMHEQTLSAGLCAWVEDYPYAYRHGASGAEFVAALDLYVRYSGDLELARELLPNVTRALEWCARRLDAEGRLTHAEAGHAALATGPTSETIESEVFLQGAWIAALGAAIRLCQALDADPAPYRELQERARMAFEIFWSEEQGRYGFALLGGSKRCDDLTAYLGYPLSRGLGERARAWASVQALNHPALMSDWGVRTFAKSSALDGSKGGGVSPYLTNFATLAFYAHGHAFAAHQALFAQVALSHFGGLGFLEEELEGDRIRVSKGGVPHQVSSSAALVESVLLGLFGVDASTGDRRLAFRSTLPPHWDEARLRGLRVGESRVDVRLYRRRQRGVTVLGVELEGATGVPLQFGFAPVLPPMTRLLDGPGWLRPAGAVVPRNLHRTEGERLTLEARVLEGPAVVLPSTLPARGEVSRCVRLVEQSCDANGLRWVFFAPAGTSLSLPFFCDFDVEVSGAQLVSGQLKLAFPQGGPDEWTRCEVGITSR